MNLNEICIYYWDTNQMYTFTLCFKNSKFITGNVLVLTTSSCCNISYDCISVKPCSCKAMQQRCDCSMQGEKEQKRPPKSQINFLHKVFSSLLVYLPLFFKASTACSTACWGAGKSKNTASALPFNSSPKPF